MDQRITALARSLSRSLSLGLALSLAATPTAAAGETLWPDHPENVWVHRSPREGRPVPRFGWEGSGSYDPARRSWIHQGGHDGNPQGFALFTCDLASGAWEQKFPNTSPPGSCCVDGANVFDEANRRFVRFPGAALGHGWQWSRKVKMKSSPVWLYDPEGNAWTNMKPPPYREPEKYSKETLGSLNAGATYDPIHAVALSFGGQTSGGDTNNLFVYDAYQNLLERLVAEGPPEARDGHGLCYDERNDCLVLFGSQYGSDERTWIYRYGARRWEGLDLSPRPPGKKKETYSTIPKMAHDSLNGISLAIVWDDATGEHQSWALDLAARKWTRLNPSKEPESSASRSRNLAYSAEENVFILELSSKERGPEIWTYRYKSRAPEAEARPARPAGLSLITGPRGARLSWNGVPGAKEYRIYRAESAKAWETLYAKVGATVEARYEDRGLEAGRVYFFKVAAVSGEGMAIEGPASFPARTQPRVLLRPVVSTLAVDRVEIDWSAHPASDIAGYNVYRGVATVATVKKGEGGPWKDNDPEYAEPQIVAVRDITGLTKLNELPLGATTFIDTRVDLSKKGPESGDYQFAVEAYVVRAVNRLGVESGPSPYALTIPSEPEHVLVREADGAAEIRWDAAREKGIRGYLIYEITERTVARITPEAVKGTTHRRAVGGEARRYCVVAVDALRQEGQPSSPAWYGQSYKGFYAGEWHQ